MHVTLKWFVYQELRHIEQRETSPNNQEVLRYAQNDVAFLMRQTWV